jgi:exodeoxyribonuclease V alpha subunit
MAEEKVTNAQVLTGAVDRVTYHNEENGYSVLRLNVTGMSDPVTVLGNFSTVSPGEQLRLTGWWTTAPKVW